MSDEEEVKSGALIYRDSENLEWKSITEHGKPEAGRRVHLKLAAEYYGSWEPEEGQNKKGQWILDNPLVNTQDWRYVYMGDEMGGKTKDI